jgi:hypothetical protein
VQVCSDVVNVLAGVDLVSSWKIQEAHPSPGNASIIAATHAGPYLLVRLSGGGAILVHEARDGAELEEVARSGKLLRPTASSVADIGASCLYRDSTGWLQAHDGIDSMEEVTCRKPSSDFEGSST